MVPPQGCLRSDAVCEDLAVAVLHRLAHPAPPSCLRIPRVMRVQAGEVDVKSAKWLKAVGRELGRFREHREVPSPSGSWRPGPSELPRPARWAPPGRDPASGPPGRRTTRGATVLQDGGPRKRPEAHQDNDQTHDEHTRWTDLEAVPGRAQTRQLGRGPAGRGSRRAPAARSRKGPA